MSLRVEVDGRDVTDKLDLKVMEQYDGVGSIEFTVPEARVLPGSRVLLWKPRQPGILGWLRAWFQRPVGLYVVTRLAGNGSSYHVTAIDYESWWRRNHDERTR